MEADDGAGELQKWYDEAEAVNLVDDDAKAVSKPVPTEAVAACRKRAQDVLERMLMEHSHKKNSSDEKWLQTVMTNGTLADKVSAMSLMVGDQPLLHLSTLNSLLLMCGKNNPRESGVAIDAVRDVFMLNLLPPSRKLKTFTEQALHLVLRQDKKMEEGVKDTALLYWLLEDHIKRRYTDYLDIVEKTLNNSLEYVKKGRLMIVWELLCSCREQEQRLLAMLVNKLGDPDRKVASKVVYLLSELLGRHPGMKLPVVKEIERLLFRPNVSLRSQYFACIFLNQIIFTSQDGHLADMMIRVYLTLFNYVLSSQNEGKDGDKNEHKSDDKKAKPGTKKDTKKGKKGGKKGGKKSWKKKGAKAVASSGENTANSRLLSALLTGVNRAFPFASDSQVFEEQVGALFGAVHRSSSFNTSIQALLLLYQVMSSQSASSSRFYRAVYQILFNPQLRTSSKHGFFLNLLFKTMKNDANSARVAAFAKRLLQVCFQHAPPFVCSSLFLLSEVGKSQAGLTSLFNRSGTDRDEEEHFKDAVDDENEPKKQKQERQQDKNLAVNFQNDDDDEEEHFRDAPDSEDDEQKTIAAKTTVKMKDLKNPKKKGKKKASEDDENENENFKDAEETSEDEQQNNIKQSNKKNKTNEKPTEKINAKKDKTKGKQNKGKTGKEEIEQKNQTGSLEENKTKSEKEIEKLINATGELYDSSKRDPEFARADRVPLWELAQLTQHYHPSVRQWANMLLHRSNISYSGEPLTDFTNTAFLDRFAYRNPKKLSDKKKNRLQARQTQGFLNQKDAHTMFYTRYFQEKQVRDAADPAKAANLKLKEELGEQADDIDAYADAIMERELLAVEKGAGADKDDDDDFQLSDDDEGELPLGDDDFEVPQEEDDNELPEGPDDDEDDDDDEAQAAREAFGASDDDEGGGGFEAEEDDAEAAKGKKGKREASVFADADDFEDLLRGDGDENSGGREAFKRKHTNFQRRQSGRGRGRSKTPGRGRKRKKT